MHLHKTAAVAIICLAAADLFMPFIFL